MTKTIDLNKLFSDDFLSKYKKFLKELHAVDPRTQDAEQKEDVALFFLATTKFFRTCIDELIEGFNKIINEDKDICKAFENGCITLHQLNPRLDEIEQLLVALIDDRIYKMLETGEIND